MKTTRRSLAQYLLSGLAAFTLFGAAAQPADADASAAALLAPHVQWAKAQPNGPNGTDALSCTMVSNNTTLQASYLSADLPYARFRPPLTPGFQLVDGFTNSPLDQLFSDRTWFSSANGAYNPFNPMAPEKVRISLDAGAGQLIIERLTPSNLWPYTFVDLKASNGMLQGQISGGPIFLISVKDKFIPQIFIIRR